MNRQKINKYIEFISTKFEILKQQKLFGSQKIKYLFYPSNNSNDLVIIFSGMPREGVKARYNYVRTLKNIDANKLFILDDFGFDKRGNYYLGKNKELDTANEVKKLIKYIIKKHNISGKTIYGGSSKGGYAALYFGIQEKNSYLIIGSLQYRLGTFLNNNDSFKENQLKYILGENFSIEEVNELDKLLKDTLYKYKEIGKTNKIILHYSEEEPIYNNHIQYLITDFSKLKFDVTYDVASYKKHSDLSLYFPDFLYKKVFDLLNNE